MMKSESYKDFGRLTGDTKGKLLEVLYLRREELRKLLIVKRDKLELVRLQGRAEEVDKLIEALKNKT